MNLRFLFRVAPVSLALLGMAGCSETPVESSGSPAADPAVTLQFDPANGNIPYPNDLYGFDHDGTLSVPGEADWSSFSELNSPDSFWHFYGTQKGWGARMPIIIQFVSHAGEVVNEPVVDETSLEQGILIYRETPEGLVPQQWGKDFKASLGQLGELKIEPVGSFAQKTRYLVVLTRDLKDKSGQSVQLPEDYKLLLGSNDTLGKHLKKVIKQLSKAGIHKKSIVFAADFTTV
ncbi:hypothetical protein [Endozoicomonas arenosclerae]|uniref:hypothetical protein n=1 Tax=Endozoicomonas arenosclerae TaxID=1633495 RepID=UPI00078364C5|nr:hypothetical protein [Endozoicomonas arenosclerae]